HLRSALAGVAQPESPAQGHTGDPHPGQVAAFVELDHLDQAADGHRADLPVHDVARTHAGPLIVLRLPPLEVRHERRVAVGVADYLPDEVGVGVDHALGVDAHQPITGNRRWAASRSTPACRLSITLSCTAWSSPSTAIGSCTSIVILVGSGKCPARSL